MALNWVMLPETGPTKLGFVPLPNERPVWHSSLRVQFDLTTPRTYPAHDPINIKSSDGTVYLTNQRLIYLPKKQTSEFQSFSAPLLNLHDSHLVMPWFGPNSWTSTVQPVQGGNISHDHSQIELKLTFKEGGAPDFTQKFEQIKERLSQVVEAAREANASGQVDMSAVHLDELPSYESSGHNRQAAGSNAGGPLLDTVYSSANINYPVSQPATAPTQTRRTETPSDAPPGYNETEEASNN